MFASSILYLSLSKAKSSAAALSLSYVLFAVSVFFSFAVHEVSFDQLQYTGVFIQRNRSTPKKIF